MPTQKYTLEDLFRPQVPPTPLGSSAALGGPRPGLEEAAATAAGRPEPEPGAAAGTLAEIGASAALPGVGGLVTRPLLRAASPLVRAGVAGLTRIGLAGGGGLAASEAFAPEEEDSEAAEARRIIAFTSGAVGEAAVPPLRAVGRAFKRRMFAGPEELLVPDAAAAQGLVSARGATLTPGQFRTGFLGNLLENIAEASFIGGGFIRRTRSRAASAAVDAVQDASARFARTLNAQQIGKVVDAVINNSAEAQRGMTAAAYKALDGKLLATGNPAVVNASNVAGEMGETLRKYLVAGDPKARAIMRTLRELQRGPVTFSEADGIRGMLLSLSRKSADDLIPDVNRLAGHAAKLVDQQIQVAGLSIGTAGQEVLEAFSLARGTARLGKEVFNDEILGQVVGRVAPEDLARALFKADSPSRIQAVHKIIFEPRFRQAVGDPGKIWARIQDSYLGSLKHEAGSIGELSGRKLGAALDDARGTFGAMFPDPVQRNNLRISARALELAQGRAGGDRTGSILIQLTQAGSVGRVAGAAAEGTLLGGAVIGVGPFTPGVGTEEGVILLGPGALSLVLSNRTFANWMLKRAQTRITRAGQKVAPILAQTVSHMMDTGVPFTYLSNSGEKTEVPAGGGEFRPRGQPSLKPVSKQ